MVLSFSHIGRHSHSMWYFSIVWVSVQGYDTRAVFFSVAFFDHRMSVPTLHFCLCHCFSFVSVSWKMHFMFSQKGNPIFISLLFSLLQFIPHTLSCRPNRFGWQIQLEAKLEGSIKLYICRGIFNYHHSLILIQNHEKLKIVIIIPIFKIKTQELKKKSDIAYAKSYCYT